MASPSPLCARQRKSATCRSVLVIALVLMAATICQPSLAFSSNIRPILLATTRHTAALTRLAAAADSSVRQKKGAKLSRPERKALERQKKEAAAAAAAKNKKSRRKHNYGERQDLLLEHRQPGEGRYDLHSTVISQLDKETTTPDDVLRAIKRAQNLHDVHDLKAIERFLLEQTDETFAYGFRGSLLSRLAVAALHMDNHRLARLALDERRKHHRASFLPMESAAIVRGLLRVHNVSDALFVLDDELALPAPQKNKVVDDLELAQERNLLRHRALALSSFASRHFFELEPGPAVQACRQLARMGSRIQAAGMSSKDVGLPWDRILKGAAQCEAARREGRFDSNNNKQQPKDDMSPRMPCNVVYAVLEAINAFPATNSDRVYERLSNALIRRVVFVTGSVDMSTLPPADRGEVAFIGRSNVGKSSLVNMVTNRKSLAYTSKRPGKTQQFNYFAVNDKVDLEREIRFGDTVTGSKDADSFYIVDLPGFGYAEVPAPQRRHWKEFMHDYVTGRSTLKVLFHLVDARHGPTDGDAEIMRQMSQDLPPHVKYAIVLTKADKNIKGATDKMTGKVSPAVMENLRTTMEENGVGRIPVLLTSSQTKLGRNEVWKYLQRAAEA